MLVAYVIIDYNDWLRFYQSNHVEISLRQTFITPLK